VNPWLKNNRPTRGNDDDNADQPVSSCKPNTTTTTTTTTPNPLAQPNSLQPIKFYWFQFANLSM